MLPIWLSPVQIRFIPVGSEFLENCEQYIDDTDLDLYAVGCLTDNVAHPGDNNSNSFQASGAGSYEEVDFSGSIPAGYNGAFCQFIPDTYGVWSNALREYGSSHDEYHEGTTQNYAFTEIDSNRKGEQKVEDTRQHLYLMAWCKEPAAAGVAPTGALDGPLVGPLGGPI